jgi:hypothetical protein
MTNLSYPIIFRDKGSVCCSYEETKALVEVMIQVFFNINIIFTICNEQADSSGRDSNSYSGDIRFNCR